MSFKTVRLLGLVVFVLWLGIPAIAQNTKGDRPTPTPRESRFKTPRKAKKAKPPTRRVRRGDDRPSRTGAPQLPQNERRDKPGKPISPQFSRSKPGKTDRAWQGDITRRRIEPRSSTSRAKNVYPQPATVNYSSRSLKQAMKENRNPNVRRVQKMQEKKSDQPRVGKPIKPTFHKTRPQHQERAWRGDITGRRIRAGSSDRLRPPAGQQPRGIIGTVRASPGRRSGAGPAGATVGGRKFRDRSFYVNNKSLQRSGSARSRTALGQLQRHYNQRGPARTVGQLAPRSASASYMARRSTNVWAHFPRPKRKGERAVTRDLAGRRLRAKNFETQRPQLLNPTLKYQRRVASGERPYKGPAAGSHVSRTRSGRAWLGDIAHRAIRGGFRSKKGEPRAGPPIFGRGPGLEDRRIGQYQGNLRTGGRVVGDQGEAYTGNIRFRKPLKGGGSVSGGWNNKGQPIRGRTPGKGADAIGYTGNIKAGRRAYSDQGEEYSGDIRGRRQFNDQGEEYTGNIRFRKPLKGGGSISGGWNNKGQPIRGRTPGKGADAIGYSGNIKAGKRVYGDQGEGYAGNIRGKRQFNDQGEEYSGNIRRGRRSFSDQGEEYSGNIPLMKGRFRDQGEEYPGNIRARRAPKGGGSVSGRLWNNDERAIDGKPYEGQTRLSRYTGNVKVKKSSKDHEESDFQGDIKISRRDYRVNPNSSDAAVPVLKASAATQKAGSYSSGVRRNWEYIRNPSSAEEAQKTREPGRAFGRLADFQGNIQVKRFDFFKKSDLHPDAQFVRTNKNNVPEERDMLTNFRLWWARFFRKAETQPDHLKENDKSRRPRYDNGEAGLWYE